MSTLPAEGGGGGNVVTDRELFDHSVAPEPSPAPAPAPSEQPSPAPAPTQQQQPETTGQPGQPARDDRGRFAPQQGQPQQPPQQRPPQQQQPQQRQPEDHRVPLRELLEERERRQRIEMEHQQLMAHLQRQQQPPPGPETIFDGPDDYLQQRVMQPLRQEGYQMMLQVKDGISREMANNQFGEQVVTAALSELMKVRQTPDGDLAFRKIMASGHPYGELVKWQQQQRAHAAIGNDPQAWLRQQQQTWFNDPRVRAAMLESIRAGAGGQQQQGNGRAPNVSLPPSLSTVPGTSGRESDLGDLSSESLFAYATKP